MVPLIDCVFVAMNETDGRLDPNKIRYYQSMLKRQELLERLKVNMLVSSCQTNNWLVCMYRTKLRVISVFNLRVRASKYVQEWIHFA